MRQKRAKVYRKLMALYSMTFGFREPYQVLVDSLMCKSAIEYKIDLVKQLGTVLQGVVKPMITQCCIHELYLQGRSQQPAVDLAKTFERRKCNHREPIPGEECLAGVVGPANKHRYVIATQSQVLRAVLRSIPAVPIVHINRTVMVLEPPSDATTEAKNAIEERTLQPTAAELAFVGSSKSVESTRKKKGPKGPNPLSIKRKKPAEPLRKKTKGSQGSIDPAGVGEKRKRASIEEGDAKVEEWNNEIHIPSVKRRKRRKTTTISVPDN